MQLISTRKLDPPALKAHVQRSLKPLLTAHRLKESKWCDGWLVLWCVIWDKAFQRGFIHWKPRIHLLIPWVRRGYEYVKISWMAVLGQNTYPSNPNTLLPKVPMNRLLRKNKKRQTLVKLPPESLSGPKSCHFRDFLVFQYICNCHCISLPCTCALWAHANF